MPFYENELDEVLIDEHDWLASHLIKSTSRDAVLSLARLFDSDCKSHSLCNALKKLKNSGPERLLEVSGYDEGNSWLWKEQVDQQQDYGEWFTISKASDDNLDHAIDIPFTALFDRMEVLDQRFEDDGIKLFRKKVLAHWEYDLQNGPYKIEMSKAESLLVDVLELISVIENIFAISDSPTSGCDLRVFYNDALCQARDEAISMGWLSK